MTLSTNAYAQAIGHIAIIVLVITVPTILLFVLVTAKVFKIAIGTKLPAVNSTILPHKSAGYSQRTLMKTQSAVFHEKFFL